MNAEIKNEFGEKIDYDYRAGSGSLSDWIILLGHGVTGNRERPVVAETAQALNEAGYTTLAFSFSGNGDSEGEFTESNISKEVKDLEAVINAVGNKDICYIGHSMGGAVGVITAASNDKIKLLISLAGMVDTKKFALTEFGEKAPDEGLMWEEDACPLSSAFMDDLCETVGSVIKDAEKINIPWLLIHGTEDDVVLIQDSRDVKALKGEQVELVEIEGADHSFNDAGRKPQTEAVANWLKSQLATV